MLGFLDMLKKSTSKAVSSVIVMLVILLIGGMLSKSHSPKPKETIPPIESSVPTLTPSITPTKIENNEPTEISICDASVLDGVQKYKSKIITKEMEGL